MEAKLCRRPQCAMWRRSQLVRGVAGSLLRSSRSGNGLLASTASRLSPVTPRFDVPASERLRP
ncbi:hypothetical protein PLANTIT3_20035 [Plantibacter sp. T3]|nr:hypothetical protein PLANTIT3_20035 [Plantibacter sp. T3]